MKYSIRCAFLLALGVLGAARSGLTALDCKLLAGQGGGDRIPFVFMAEGYTEGEHALFDSDVQRAVATFFRTSPFHEYRNYFAAYSAWTPSMKSGIGLEASDSTYFRMTYSSKALFSGADLQGVLERDSGFRCPDHDPRWLAEIAHFVILSNVSSGGGLGYPYGPVFLGRTEVGGVFVHEMGHAIGALADEYERDGVNLAPISALGSTYNLAYSSSRDSVPWRQWISQDVPVPTPETLEFDTVVGVFEGAAGSSTNRYRPSMHCTMRGREGVWNQIYPTMCNICREGLAVEILAKWNTWNPFGLGMRRMVRIDTVYPAPESTVRSGKIVVKTIPVDTAPMVPEWRFNGIRLAGVRETLDVAKLSGNGSLEVVLVGTSPFIRNPDLVVHDTLRWTIQNGSSSVAALAGANEIRRVGPSLFLVPAGVAIPRSGYDAQGRIIGLSIVGKTVEGSLVGSVAGTKIWIDPR